MTFDPNSLLARDLGVILADAAALPAGSPNSFTFGGKSYPCEAGAPAENLSPTFSGEEGAPAASIMVAAAVLPAGICTGCRVGFAGKQWRVTGIEEAPDALEKTLELEGIRK